MKWIWIPIGIIIGLTIYGAIDFFKNSSKEKEDHKENTYQYKKRKYLFTKNELYFYRDLQKSIEGMNLTIFAKVRLADIIEPTEKQNWNAAFNKIKSKHVDFVLCENQTFQPKIIIELDDNSHNAENRKQRDLFVDNVLKMSNLTIIHTYSADKIKEKIQEHLSLSLSR